MIFKYLKLSLFLVAIFSLLSASAQVKSDVCTPKGTPVIAYITPENTDYWRNYYDTYYANAYPNATQIQTYDGFSSTRKFNCHGYAWHIADGGSARWIGIGGDNDPEYGYWQDGSYIEAAQSVYPGKVNWSSGDHSAITTENPGLLISKWNEYPLMRHAWDDSPYGTSNLKYYKLNFSISGPSTVCSSGNTFTISNLPPVNSIVWEGGPGLYITSGQNTPTCTFSATGSASFVRATVVTTCGTTITLPQKNVTAAMTASFTGTGTILYEGSGQWTATASGCTGPYQYQWWLREDTYPPMGAILVGEGNQLTLWSVPRSGLAESQEQGLSDQVMLQPPTSTSYYLSVQAIDANGMMYYTPERLIVAYGDVDLINPIERMAVGEAGVTSNLQMSISPNPATDEATVEISSPEAQVLDESTEWQVEIYDAIQSLQTKVQKIKGRKQTIRTTGWKEGVYIVRARIGNEVLSDKLVVKP